MQNAEYQEMPCISSHWLKDMLDSPITCYRKHLDPLRTESKPSGAMRFGTLIHCLALTPLQFSDEFIIDTDNRSTRAGKAHYAELARTGRIFITPDEFERARAIVVALKTHPDARQLLTGGQKEKTFIQERERGLLPLKARLDIHHEPQRLVVELKTIHDIHRIQTAINRYHYPLSAAFYADISQSLSVHFIFVQTQEPYEVAVLDMDKAQLQAGREQWQTALAQFDECWRRNEWPEAEPAALDDDPLLMPVLYHSGRRFEIPTGELAL